MTTVTSHPTIQVPVYEKTLFALVALKRYPDESLAAVIERVACASQQRHNEPTAQARGEERKSPEVQHKHRVVFLDSVIGAHSLGGLYGKLIDAVASIDPGVLENLASMKARTRRYVAKSRNCIHPGRPDLPTLKTLSGWYVSKNVGRDDFIRGVKALCLAGDLEFGKDIKFPPYARSTAGSK